MSTAAALGGCSLTLSGPSSERPRNQRPSCSTSKGLVALDGIMGATLGIATLAALGSDAGGEALIPAVASAAFLLAAVSGNGKVNDCREAIAAFEDGPRRAPIVDDDDAQVARSAEPRGPGGVGPGGVGPGGVAPVRPVPPAMGGASGTSGKLRGTAPGARPAAPPQPTPPVAAPPQVVMPPVAAAPPVAAPPPAAAPQPVTPPPPAATPPAAPPPAATPPAAAPAKPPSPKPAPSPAKPPSPPPPNPERWVDFWKELP